MDGRSLKSKIAEIYQNPDGTQSIYVKGRMGQTEITPEDLDLWQKKHLENGAKFEIKETISVFYPQE